MFLAVFSHSQLRNVMFNKLSEVISYYQRFILTGHIYQYRADNLLYFDRYDLKDIKRLHIRQYAKQRRLSVKYATINREIAFARAAINATTLDYEIPLNNPFKSIKFTEEDHIPNYLTIDQYNHLLSTALQTGNNNLHDFLVLLTMTGCRPKELLTLTWDNVYLDKKQFVVRNYFSKSKRTMYKYLNQTAYDVLKNKSETRIGTHVFTNPATGKAYTTFTKTFTRCKKRAGIDCTLYDLRHTYASWLVQSGVTIYTVKDLLGHEDIESTQRYAHLDYATLLNAVDKIG